MVVERIRINDNTDNDSIDITPQGISSVINTMQATNLDIYTAEASEGKRAKNIGMRRPFITKLDTTLQALKEQYPAETRSNKGHRQPNKDYQRASTRLREYRRQLSMVQKADRLTLIGKL